MTGIPITETSDQEERSREGYSIPTHYQFSPDENFTTKTVSSDDKPLIELRYAPRADIWRNRRDSERGATGGTITMKTYRELPDALEAVHEWMLMLADETAIHPSIVTVVERMRKNVARRGIGEDAVLPSGPDEIMQCDELRRWFEREMGAPE